MKKFVLNFAIFSLCCVNMILSGFMYLRLRNMALNYKYLNTFHKTLFEATWRTLYSFVFNGCLVPYHCAIIVLTIKMTNLNNALKLVLQFVFASMIVCFATQSLLVSINVSEVWNIEFKLRIILGHKLGTYNEGSSNDTLHKWSKMEIDNLQEQLNCCGIDSYTDWFKLNWRDPARFNETYDLSSWARAPISCCKEVEKCNGNLSHGYYVFGCLNKVVSISQSNFLIDGVLVGISLLIHAILIFILYYSYDLHRNISVNEPKNLVKSISSLMKYVVFVSDHNVTHPEDIEANLFAVNNKRRFRKPADRNREEYGVLRKYFPLIYLLINFKEPNFVLYSLKLILQSLLGLGFGFIILHLFTNGMDKLSTLVEGIEAGLLILFVYGFNVSYRFRCMCFLMIPAVMLKIGRAYIFVSITDICRKGPITSISSNMKASIDSLECVVNKSRTMIQRSFNWSDKPVFDLVNEMAESSDALQSITSKWIENNLQQTRVFTSAENDSTRIHETVRENTQSNHELKNMFESVLSRLNQLETTRYFDKVAKLERSLRKLQNNFKTLKTTNIEGLKKIYSNDSATLDTQFRGKVQSACVMSMQTKWDMCSQMINSICETAKDDPSVRRNFGMVGWASDCPSVMRKSRVCSTADSSEAKKIVKKCQEEERDKMKLKDDFAVEIRGSDIALQNLHDVFKLDLQWNYHFPSSLNLLQDTNLASAARTTFGVKDFISSISQSLSIINFLKKIFILLFVYSCYSYVRKYETEEDFDNRYVSKDGYFMEINSRRIIENKTTLLPFKKFELKNISYIHQLKMSSNELIKSGIQVVRVVILILFVSACFWFDNVLFHMMLILRLATNFNMTIQSDDTSSYNITGDGLFKILSDNLINKLQSFSNQSFNFTLERCKPQLIRTQSVHLNQVYILLVLLLASSVLNGYCLRLRHIIVSYFMPLSEKKRSIYLYNKMLILRDRKMNSRKQLILTKFCQNRLIGEDNFLMQLQKYRAFKWLSVAIRRRCVVCEDMETKDFRFCEFDSLAYCPQCWEEIANKQCLLCIAIGNKRTNSHDDKSRYIP